jgi:hypothetical protein
MARELVVRIVGDSRDVERALARSSKAAKGFEAQITGLGGSFRRAFAGTAAAFGATAGIGVVVDQLKGAVDAASDLSEQMSKTNVVFGKSAAGITDWSTKTATAMGLSQRKALAAASTFGLLFKNVGQGDAAASDLSTRLVALGADLASLNNTSVQEALDSIRSGLTGEIEPLRKYGVFLSEAATQQQALADTGKKSAKELTTGEKVLARYELLLKGTTVAQGDFARTSGGLANQQRILTAQIDDLKTGLGEALLPAITDVVTKMNEWLSDPENKKAVIDGFTGAVEALGAAASTTAGFLGDLKDFWDRLPDFGKNKGLLDYLKFGGGGTGFIPDRLIGGGFSAPGRAGGAGGRGGVAAGVKALQDALGETAAPGTAKAAGGVTQTQRNRWWDAMISRQIARVQDITSLKGQVSRLGEIAGLIRARMAATKDITRRLTLEDQLLDVLRTQRQTKSTLSDEIKQRAADAKDAAKAAREATAELASSLIKPIDLSTEGGPLTIGQVNKAVTENTRKRIERAQNLALGLTAEGGERAAGVKTLRRQAQQLTNALKGTLLDTKGNRSILRGIREVLSGELGAISRTRRLRIAEMIDNLNSQLDGVGRKKGRRRVGGITVDKYGNAIGPGLPAEKHVPSVINRFTGAVQDATAALSNFEKLRIFADLRNFGGNLWSRAGTAALGGRMTSPGSMGMPRISRGTGQTGMPGIFGGGGRHLSGGVTVVQNFNAPTTDRHREARYAMMATRAVFDS